MSNEATINAGLQIKVGEIDYQSRPTSFKGNVTGAKGPVPGAITVTIAGTDIDFSQLVLPGYCRIQNLDTTNVVHYGIWDPTIQRFYPLGELLPGETYPLRLSRYLSDAFGTGTGTIGPDVPGDDNCRLRFKADIASCNVLVEAFEH